MGSNLSIIIGFSVIVVVISIAIWFGITKSPTKIPAPDFTPVPSPAFAPEPTFAPVPSPGGPV